MISWLKSNYGWILKGLFVLGLLVFMFRGREVAKPYNIYLNVNEDKREELRLQLDSLTKQLDRLTLEIGKRKDTIIVYRDSIRTIIKERNEILDKFDSVVGYADTIRDMFFGKHPR